MTLLVDTSRLCPPNPDCECVCGIYAENHQLVDHPIEPAPGEDLACPDRQACSICDGLVCMEHDHMAEWCAEHGGGPHHDECVDRCIPCVREIAADFAVEQGISARCW